MLFVALRKLIEKRKNVEGKKEKRNIIRDYTNYDSQVYAPMTRIGVYLDAGADQYTVRNSYNTTLHGRTILATIYNAYITDILTTLYRRAGNYREA